MKNRTNLRIKLRQIRQKFKKKKYITTQLNKERLITKSIKLDKKSL